MGIPKKIRLIAFAWTSLFWLACVAVPLFSVISSVLNRQSWRLLFEPSLISIARATAWQAFLSTLVSGFFGLFLGLWVGRFISKRPRSMIQTLFWVPYSVPTLVAAVAWVIWLGRSGILSGWGISTELVYSLKGVVLAHSFLNIPWVAYLVSQSRKEIPQIQFEAAQTLGANWFSGFQWITWPHVRWVFLGACAQVMALCSMSFVLVLILGGGPPVQTLETELYGHLRYGSIDLSGAAACAVWELLLTLLPWGMVLFLQSRESRDLGMQRSLFLTESPLKADKVLTAGVILVGLFFILPYGVVFNRHVMRLITDPELRTGVIESLKISLHLAVGSSVLAVFTVYAALICEHSLRQSPRGKRLEAGFAFLMGVPSGISILVLSLGGWLAYGKWIDPFEGSLVAIVALQGTLFFPIVHRVMWAVAQGVQLRQLETAISLGASPWKAFWHIEWPRWRGPTVSVLAGVAGASLGEVGAVSLFYSEKRIPLSLLISRWMGQYRFEEAQAMVGLLFLLSFILIVGSFVLSQRLSPSDKMRYESRG